MTKRVVVSAVVDDDSIVLYLADGETVTLPSDSVTTHKIMERVTPALANNQTIELDEEAQELNIFKVMEDNSKGLVRFYRVAKAAFTGKSLTETEIETIALPQNTVMTDEAMMVAVVDLPGELLLSDEPSVASNVVQPQESTSLGTAMAVAAAATVPAKRTAVIPNADALQDHIAHAGENTIGVQRFLERVGAVIANRKHSIEDLMEFMRKADLPIADDGCIIAYKRLNKKGSGFVDTHTGNVTQRVGSKVFMKESMVDPDRRNECSNGLHIGRRDYMGSFGGDGIVIVKIAPEDVIAVPRDYGRSKMRCSGYHIVSRMNNEAFKLVTENKPMTDNEKMAKLLTRIIQGDHVAILEHVEITGPRGTGVVITKFDEPEVPIADVAPIDEAHADAVQEVAAEQAEMEASEPDNTVLGTTAPEAEEAAVEATPEPVKAPVKAAGTKAKAPAKKAKKAKVKPTKAIERKEPQDDKTEKLSVAKVKEAAKKAKAAPKTKATKAAEPLKAPVIPQEGDMTEDQKFARDNWYKVESLDMSMSELARLCNTSTRSLGRWATKFNF